MLLMLRTVVFVITLKIVILVYIDRFYVFHILRILGVQNMINCQVQAMTKLGPNGRPRKNFSADQRRCRNRGAIEQLAALFGHENLWHIKKNSAEMCSELCLHCDIPKQ